MTRPVGGQQTITDGLLGRKSRIDAALQSIPLNRIESNAADAVRDVLGNPSFYRQMPPKSLECDPQLLKFMVRHPEVMVNIWEMIGITNITAKRTGERTFYADDGSGTTCNCELIYSDDTTHVYYGTGNYDGPMVPRTIKGRVVCVLRTQAQEDATSHSGYKLTSRMEIFLRVDNFGADLLTRTMGPLVGKVTDHNFEETSKFVGQLSEFCAAYPHGAANLASNLNVSHEAIRQEFVTIATRIASRPGNALAESMSRPPINAIANRPVPQESNSIELVDSAPYDARRGDLKTEIGHLQIATLPRIVTPTEYADHQIKTADSQDAKAVAPVDAGTAATTSSRKNSPRGVATETGKAPPREIIPRKPSLQLRR